MAVPDPSGRFVIHEGSPPSAPGTCAVCRSCGGDGRTFVDFGFTQEFYGRVYFCSFCFEECTSYLGWTSPVNTEHMSLANEALENEVTDLKEENDRLNRLLNNSLTDVQSQLAKLLAAKEATRKSVGRPKKPESESSS